MREQIVVEHDEFTGPRLKYYSRAADVSYWTERWEAAQGASYERERRGHLPHQLRDTFARWVDRGARVLEAGCGLGHFTVAAAALGFAAEGLDWSEPTIGRLRQRFPSIPWHVGDVRALRFETGSFDAIYSPGVCEHFEEGPVRVLTETHRVLRLGGIAVISTPCFNSWLLRRASTFIARQESSESGFYQYAFTPDGLARVLTTIGFDVVHIRPYGALDTFVQFGNWRVPRPLTLPLAYGMDYVPVVRNWGSTCLWVARRR
ncbi:MAG TPA: class I SAM-dependent methyltransferase [Vicinamibacterales bacterium]